MLVIKLPYRVPSDYQAHFNKESLISPPVQKKQPIPSVVFGEVYKKARLTGIVWGVLLSLKSADNSQKSRLFGILNFCRIFIKIYHGIIKFFNVWKTHDMDNYTWALIFSIIFSKNCILNLIFALLSRQTPVFCREKVL